MNLDIVVPVYNEEKELKKNILALRDFLLKEFDRGWRIVIADNASTDKTSKFGKELAAEYKNIDYFRLQKKGRGRAIKKIWSRSGADVLVYMDIDLSTHLKHLPNIVKAVNQGADIAIGSRLLKNSQVKARSFKRELISRAYNALIKLFFKTKFSDAQCGFKAVSRKASRKLLPHIKNNEWFMDSELLIIAEKSGFHIHEEPVLWRDNPGSTVRILPTAWQDLKGLLRLFINQPWKAVQK